MSSVRRVVNFVRRLLHPGPADQDLSDEVQSYFEIQVERRLAGGLSPEEARRVTRVQFGGADQVKENVREARMGAFLETTFTDLRYAWRVLRKNPGFALVAILSLGLGLGANTAIFSLINTVMLKSLPVKSPDRLFFVDNSGGKSGGSSGPPYPCYEILRDQNHYFSGLAAFAGERLKVTIDGVSEQITGQHASGSYFDVLGVGAALGRVLTPADDSEIGRGGPHGAVAVISYRLWERRFGRSPDVLGKSVQVGSTWVTIVGVTPPEFFGLTVGSPIDITVPMVLTSNNLRSPKSWWFSVVGRLKDGASEVPARAELNQYFQTYMEDVGAKGSRYFSGIVLVPAAKGLDELRRQFSKPLLIVMTIVGLVLLIGCANVANLLLARAGARRDEITLRLAIGASRGRLIRQLVAEGLLLMAAAAAAGLFLARWGVALLVTLLASGQGHTTLQPTFDARVLAFTAAVSLVTALLFSLAPAFQATRTDAAKPGGRTSTRPGTGRFRTGNILVVMQIMLSLLLLAGAALFLRTLHNLTSLDAGFNAEGVLSLRMDATLPASPPSTDQAADALRFATIGRMWEELLEPVQARPEVTAATVSSLSPLSGRDRGILMQITGQPSAAGQDTGIKINQVTSGYFEVFSLALASGRSFTPRDQANSQRVAILNESAVRARFPHSDPVGRHIFFPGQRITADYQIVGVVRDMRYVSLRKEDQPMVYVPIEQAIDPLSGVMVGIRTRNNRLGVLPVLRRQAQSVVPGGFITGVITVQQQIEQSLVGERLLSILASLFGALALFLAAIGLYGIMSYTVLRRTREIGIRIAVGAQRSAVLWLVLRATFAMVFLGLLLSAPLLLIAQKYIASELFGLTAADPISLVSAASLLLAVALAASAWPAWRASRVDPTVALRQD